MRGVIKLALLYFEINEMKKHKKEKEAPRVYYRRWLIDFWITNSSKFAVISEFKLKTSSPSIVKQQACGQLYFDFTALCA
jgi:hypothetical protein